MFKRISAFTLVFVCVFLSITAQALGAFSTNPKATDKVAKSVLMLQVFDSNDNMIATGSGFVAFNNRTIVTNYHVIEGANWMLASSDDGYQYLITKVLTVDKEKDIAICEFMSPTNLQPLRFNTNGELMRAESIVAIGSPIGITNTVSLGNISALYKEQNVSWIQFTAPISHGSSGGALFDDNGYVIGVTSSSYINTQNLNLAVHISEVETLYNEWNGENHLFDEYSSIVATPTSESISTPIPTNASIVYFPIKFGSNGELVRLLQERLIELGYMEGIADGIFDQKTETAVVKFNYQNFGLNDRIAQTKTLRLLLEGTPKPYRESTPTPVPTPKPTISPMPTSSEPYPLLKKGSQGEDVRRLQSKLIDLGYLAGNADGIFGLQTEEAVKDFFFQNMTKIREYDIQFSSKSNSTTASNAMQQFLYHGNPARFKDLDQALSIEYGSLAEWYNLSGNNLKIRFQVTNQAQKKIVKAFELYVYALDVWKNEIDSNDVYSWTTIKTVNPGTTAYSDYVNIPCSNSISTVFCGVHKILYSDGSIYYAPSVDYRSWNIQ